MPAKSQRDGLPRLEAVGGEPDYAVYEAELDFEALVSSGETRRYVLTPNGVHMRMLDDGEAESAGNPAGAGAAPFAFLSSSAAAGPETHAAGGPAELQADARAKTKLLADLLKRTGLGGGWAKDSQGPPPPGTTTAPSGDAADAASGMPAGDPASWPREPLFAFAPPPPFAPPASLIAPTALDANGVQSSVRWDETMYPADAQPAGAAPADGTPLPVSYKRRRSLSQSAAVPDAAEPPREPAPEPPRRSSSLSNRASRRPKGAKVVEPPNRSSSRGRQCRAAPASQGPAAHGPAEGEAGAAGPAANADAEPRGDPEHGNGAVEAGRPETAAHDSVPDATAAEAATEDDARQVPQEQGLENGPVAEVAPPEMPRQGFGLTSAEPASVAGPPLAGAGANPAAELFYESDDPCTRGKDWRADCLPAALSKVEAVAQTAHRLAEENARLKKEIIEIHRNRQLENLRFERLSFAAYRKLTEIAGDKAALETEATYLRNSLAELTAMIHLVDSGLPAQPPLRPTK